MMVLVKGLILCAGWLLLAGCGSGPGREESPPAASSETPPADAARTDSRPVIVALGDSLTAGLGVESGQSYPDYLQRMLDERGYGYRVVNAGISGDTTGGGLGRLDTVVSLKPRFVILELGANDGLRGLPIASTRANLEEIVAGLKGSGAEVILAGMTLPRNYGADYIRSFEAVFTDLARKHSLRLIPFLLEGVAEEGRHMQADRLHPTAEGNRLVAANVFEALEPALKSSSAAAGPAPNGK